MNVISGNIIRSTMFNGKRILAVIPARGGSKRTPRKNIRPYQGKSLIEWAWDAAIQSKYIDVLVISTEDEQIRSKCEARRMCVIDRPADLATDEASNEDVLRHALTLYPDCNEVVLLQPTSPLRTTYDIDSCIEMNHRPVVSVNEALEKNGAVYVADADWLREGNDFSEEHYPFVMPMRRSLDIDYPEQFNS